MFAEASFVLSTGGRGETGWETSSRERSPGQRHPWKEHGIRQELTSYTAWEEHGTKSFNCLVGRFLTNLSFYSLETVFDVDNESLSQIICSEFFYLRSVKFVKTPVILLYNIGLTWYLFIINTCTVIAVYQYSIHTSITVLKK